MFWTAKEENCERKISCSRHNNNYNCYSIYVSCNSKRCHKEVNMNRNNVIRNVCAITLFLFSIATTIVMGKYGSFKWYWLALDQLMFCVGICIIRFSYSIAQFVLYSHMYKWSASDDFDDEPSEFGVFRMQLFGCVWLFLPLIMYAAISWY